ncbi:Transcriptional regulator [Nostoc sp. DSM 114161]|jgi:putative transcriptional regulator|uniref:helix-turn-helix domain-containing protein n=1 Tax=Nostoc sp. DSM 114161 TaxID=3440143 RepID=UPI00404587DF
MTVEIRLKQIRESRGLSQNALARQLEMSLGNVQNIEYGKAKSIPLDTLERLCTVLDCQIGDLLVLVKNKDSTASDG